MPCDNTKPDTVSLLMFLTVDLFVLQLSKCRKNRKKRQLKKVLLFKTRVFNKKNRSNHLNKHCQLFVFVAASV